jgi:hypothetical protein
VVVSAFDSTLLGAINPSLEFLDEKGAVNYHFAAEIASRKLPAGEIPSFRGETIL